MGYIQNRRKAFRSSSDIVSNLIARYALDESSGNAVDSSGNSRTMTQIGTVGTGSGGTANSRGTFSSANYFESSNSVFALNSGSWSFTGWFYLNSNSGVQFLVGRHTIGAADYNIGLVDAANGGSDSLMRFRILNTGGTSETDLYAPGSAVSASAWHFIAVTFNSSSLLMTAQLDSGSVGSVTCGVTPGVNTGTTTQLGALPYPGFRYPLDGYLAKARFYSRVLAAADIAALYNRGIFSTAP